MHATGGAGALEHSLLLSARGSLLVAALVETDNKEELLGPNNRSVVGLNMHSSSAMFATVNSLHHHNSYHIMIIALPEHVCW